MKKGSMQIVTVKRLFILGIVFILAVTTGCAPSGSKAAGQLSDTGASQAAVMQPLDIPEDVSCGKCGMYPARYPRWQSQIIFIDGKMTPFDGCKCMFNFLFGMDKFDKKHTRGDVSVAWVRDFNTGKWINAAAAHFVVGSNIMGPMGKELIPFADQAAAMKLQREQGGRMMSYGDINPEVMKTLGMGGMKKHMKI